MQATLIWDSSLCTFNCPCGPLCAADERTKYIKWKHKAQESTKVNEALFANAVQNIFISEFKIPKEKPKKIII